MGNCLGCSKQCGNTQLQNLLSLQENQFWQEEAFLIDKNLVFMGVQNKGLLYLMLSIVKLLLNFK